MKKIIRLVMNKWGYGDDKLENPKVIVLHNYGLISQFKLPDMSEQAIFKAVLIAEEYSKANIYLTSCNKFWDQCSTQEYFLKNKLLLSNGIEQNRIKYIGSVINTVAEVRLVKEKLAEFENSIEIAVIVDRMHARSARYIWRKEFPEANVKIRNTYGRQELEHPSFCLRTEVGWLVTNFIRHLLYVSLGGDRLVKFLHPMS